MFAIYQYHSVNGAGYAELRAALNNMIRNCNKDDELQKAVYTCLAYVSHVSPRVAAIETFNRVLAISKLTGKSEMLKEVANYIRRCTTPTFKGYIMTRLMPGAKAYVTAVARDTPLVELLDQLTEANYGTQEWEPKLNEYSTLDAIISAYVTCVERRDIDFDWQFNEQLPTEIKELWFKVEGLWEGD